MTTWQIDTNHTSAEFVATHMMFAKVRGGFSGITGTITFDPANPAHSAVTATIPAVTVTTGTSDRDAHLRSPDFFDVSNHPYITFASKSVSVANPNHAHVVGDLTIRGVTREVTLEVHFLGEGKNPWGQEVGGFSARTRVNREDFGLMWNQMLEAGGVLVGREVEIELNVQAVKQHETVAETQTA